MVDTASRFITYRYFFSLSNGAQKTFEIHLDSRTLELVRNEKSPRPGWAELNFFQCPNCPLEEKHNKYCPVALSIAEMVGFFKDWTSDEEVDLLIETKERNYLQHTTLQNGLSSLVGIYMVTSGCPVMDKLKPMVRFHLPFATGEETKYRAISMYLTAQYFLARHGEEPDWEMKNLAKIYEDIRIVNSNFGKRLKNIKIEDASLNAIAGLDYFARTVSFSINWDVWVEIETYFSAYMKKPKAGPGKK